MRRLTEYHRKRDFAATPEPASSRAVRMRSGECLKYVVQLHHARSRHFDFRLELGATLRSWAVPKGPSLDPSQKRLAVEVEDHPLDYADFEGDIPKGHYGAGHVDIWDHGEWQPHGDPSESLKKGHLAFELFGSRLHGHWDLVRTHFTGRQRQWLLVKREDAFASIGDVADDVPLSQALKRSQGTCPNRKTFKPASTMAPLPKYIGLQLARLEVCAPSTDDWLHEVKYDGYRALISRDADAVRITSRNGLDWSAQLQTLARAAHALPCRNCVLDTELVVLDKAGRSRFDQLQNRFEAKSEADILAIAFDVMFLDGDDLRSLPQIERKNALAALLAEASTPLHVMDYLEGSGPQAARAACAAGLEGIISKRRDAPYVAGRGGAWLKIKCIDAGKFAIVGYTRGLGARGKLGALLLAEPGERSADWRYVGRVGSGLSDAQIESFLKKFKPLKERPDALADPPSPGDLRGARVIWVRPTTLVEVEYRGWTSKRRLRQASLKGLPMDKSLRSIRQPYKSPCVAAAKPVSCGARAPARLATVARAQAGDAKNYPFTHPERRLFEQPPISKQQLGDFYAKLAPWLLPDLVSRPLSVIRCPDGAGGECFFQKHSSPGFSQAIRELPIADKNGGLRNYFYIENLEGLLGLVQMNVIELHPWGVRIEDIERPDRLVFDLDPAPDVKWRRVIAAALLLRERLRALKLESFVRTSGGKGLHVVVPLTPDADWATAKAFTHALARTLAEEAPDEFVSVMTRKLRSGRIFIDYLRNGRGATSVASYSVRARDGAPVATPLRWDELPRLRSGDQYRYANLARRLAKLAGEDPWANSTGLRQKLPRIG